MKAITRNIFDSREALAEALAKDVAAKLEAAIAARGQATLAVSGGKTPQLFFETLSKAEIAWDDVTVTLVDERFVPETSERSNQRLVLTTLMTNGAARAAFVPLYHPAATVEDAAAVASETIRRLPRPLDVAILGMGTDGHTASFFPHGDGLAEALRPRRDDAVAAIEAPDAGEPRLTLTLPLLASARFLALHIEGAEKQATLEAAEQAGTEEDMPIRAVLNIAPITLYWAP